MLKTVAGWRWGAALFLPLAMLALPRIGRHRMRARERGFFDTMRAPDGALPATTPALFVAVCEFERFEAIRRNVGYATASAILVQAAAAIRRVVPAAEIGRVHRTAIEFAARAGDAAAVARLLDEVLRAFEPPLHVDGCGFDLAPRIGFILTDASSSADELVERVEIALHASANAHARIIDATRDLDDATAARFGLLRDLHHAIATDGLELHYQPKLRCSTDRIDAAEALLRWQHPRLGNICPDEFIPIAEETGLIRRLTAWTLARAVHDQRALHAAGYDLTIHVNISGLLLPDPGFAAEALGLVADAAGVIGFEITETAVIDHPEQAIANLNRFAAAGIRIAIDDYGSGLSSLAYLKQLPAHELKIDKLFISGLTSSHRDPLLVRSSIDLAHALEMEVTAEGVENAMALSLLRVMGCDLIQGYLVGRPMALSPLIAFLADGDQPARIAALAPPRFGAGGGPR